MSLSIPRNEKGRLAAAFDSSHALVESVFDEEAAQLFRSTRMTQLAQRLRFDLTNALARHIELLAHFFQRVVGVHVDTEPHTKHLGFTRGQLRKYRVSGFAQ